MADNLTLERLDSMRGTEVRSSEGEKIGSVEEIYVDDDTGAPEWIGLGTGFFGTKRVLVPVAGAQMDADAITVPYTKDQVKDTPGIDEEHIDQSTEAELYGHYGLTYTERRSESGLPEGGKQSKSKTNGDDESVTRSEEELRVGKRGVEVGRARLHKWVETEPVETDVELRRERVRVERQSIDEPAPGAELGEQEIEVPVHAEEAVVQKETVAKERVSLEKDVETESETVRDEVRKEHVEVEGDKNARR